MQMRKDLDFVEEFPREPEYSLFQKVLIATKRAKDLHAGIRMPLLNSPYTKPPSTALLEIREGLVCFSEDEEPADSFSEEEASTDEALGMEDVPAAFVDPLVEPLDEAETSLEAGRDADLAEAESNVDPEEKEASQDDSNPFQEASHEYPEKNEDH